MGSISINYCSSPHQWKKQPFHLQIEKLKHQSWNKNQTVNKNKHKKLIHMFTHIKAYNKEIYIYIYVYNTHRLKRTSPENLQKGSARRGKRKSEQEGIGLSGVWLRVDPNQNCLWFWDMGKRENVKRKFKKEKRIPSLICFKKKGEKKLTTKKTNY